MKKQSHKSGEINIDINNFAYRSGFALDAPEEDFDKYGLEWQKTKRYAQDTQLRTNLTRWLQCLIPIWLGAVILILVISMFWGDIDAAVLIALLTTTTVNIIGLPYIVLKGLFDK